MIKPNELRIGNLIFCKTTKSLATVASPHPGQVIANFKYENVTADFVHCDLTELEPIAITPEWLERCGFVKKENKTQIDGIEMTFHINESTYFSSCGGIDGGLYILCLCRGNYFANNLQHLHQLQNLYFALTGEELTIKAPTQLA